MNPDSLNCWCRFSEYELEGAYIRPSASATLERYDAWEGFEASVAKQRVGGMLARAYLSLIDLADSSSAEPERDKRFSLREIKSPLEWCLKHGLLGLLFLEVRQIVLYPRWEVQGAWAQDAWPMIRQYARAPSG